MGLGIVRSQEVTKKIGVKVARFIYTDFLAPNSLSQVTRMYYLLLIQGGNFHMQIYLLISGKKNEWREVRVFLSCLANSSNSFKISFPFFFLLRFSIGQGAVFWGSMS